MPKIKMIRKEGGSRVITLPKEFPQDWRAIEIIVIMVSSDKVALQFDKVK